MLDRSPAVVNHNVVSMFAGPSRDSEVVSQLVMRSTVEILDRRGGFCFVRSDDLYTGWVMEERLSAPDGHTGLVNATVGVVFAEVYSAASIHSPLLTRLTAGTTVLLAGPPTNNEFLSLLLPSGLTGYVPVEQISRETVLPLEKIRTTALRFIGIPYLWGGTTSFGLDCSGFVQLVYRLHGILLLRDSSMQFTDRRFAAVNEGRGLDNAGLGAGDLVFFGRETGGIRRITHVGMALGDGNFVHSAGRGRGNLVTACSDPEFTATYAGARRLLPNTDLRIEAA